jgi:hypothetical protein
LPEVLKASICVIPIAVLTSWNGIRLHWGTLTVELTHAVIATEIKWKEIKMFEDIKREIRSIKYKKFRQ